MSTPPIVVTNFVGDFTKDPKQIVVDMVNYANKASNTQLEVASVSLGTPTVATDGPAGTNTSLVLSSVPGEGFIANQTILYNRLDIGSVPTISEQPTIFTVGDSTRISDLIDAINARFAINLTDGDYIDAPLPAMGASTDPAVPFNVVMTASGLIWQGTLALSLKGNDVPLSTVVVDTTMPALMYVKPTFPPPGAAANLVTDDELVSSMGAQEVALKQYVDTRPAKLG